MLNRRADIEDTKVEKDNKVQTKLQEKPVKDDNLVGASNCTTNINYTH